MSRFTHDIDFEFMNMDLDENKIKSIVNEIILINLNDDVSFEFSSIDIIKDSDEYRGFRVCIKGNVGKSIESFSIDIATGDVLTPKELNAKLVSTVNNEIIEVSVYNNSTILAEKIETIISKSDLNSRMKDYYDIYNFYTLNLIDLTSDEVLKLL